ncbi:hypothetical protein RUM44_008825 [Polyplax serrata]|uniref:Uncharacterized protein n=1 Tax=Polyplax serrata TaxID=468196 RepID=A0ABR1BDB0_POLSC
MHTEFVVEVNDLTASQSPGMIEEVDRYTRLYLNILNISYYIHATLRMTVRTERGIGFGIKREIFFLNLEDGYFGCQVNESTDVLQLYEISRLCDGSKDCYLGSDELQKELKCTIKCVRFEMMTLRTKEEMPDN